MKSLYKRRFKMYKRILIATDGSKLSAKAVKTGIKLAATLKAEVFAFMAVERYPVPYYEGTAVQGIQYTRDVRSKQKHDAQMILNQVEATGLAYGVSVTTVTGLDPIGEGIIKSANKHSCDLIVMASHGRKGIKRLLMGSETLDVLTHSTIPVLVLR
jgi:nucleotide-binding universal stress UspA family protein